MTDVEGGAPDQVLTRLRPRWTDARAEQNLTRTVARIARARRRGRVVAGAAVAASVVALAIAHVHRAPGETRVAPTPVVARAETALRLSDGSTITLGSPRAHVRVARTSRERIELELAGGPATFAIPAHAGRAVVVRMARFEVTILAAAFTLTPVEDDARVEVEHGTVEVRWSAGHAVVEAGHAVTLPPAEASSLAQRRAEPNRAAPDAEGLLRDADAARLAGHPAAAVPYYRRLLRIFPGDERAPVAAFTLGRVLLTQLDRPDEAADAFATSRRLAPAGALAEDAWAREVEAAARAGETARARSLARAYLAQHGDEPRATAVRRAGGLE